MASVFGRDARAGGARPALRLVGTESGGPSAAAARALRERHRAIERENRAASTLEAGDARRVVATRVSESLEGGRAAVLRPEARRRVVALATRLGLRPFDANLIIAIVQDGARRGVRSGDPDVHAMLRLIETPRRRRYWGRWMAGGGVARHERGRPTVERWVLAARAIAAALLGVLWGGAMVAWVVGMF